VGDLGRGAGSSEAGDRASASSGDAAADAQGDADAEAYPLGVAADEGFLAFGLVLRLLPGLTPRVRTSQRVTDHDRGDGKPVLAVGAVAPVLGRPGVDRSG